MVPGWLFRLIDNPFGLNIFNFRHWLKHRYQLKTMLRQNDIVMLLTPPNKEELAHFVGTYPESKVRSIPNSIPRVYDDQPLKKDKIILHVGRLDIIQKRADLLLDFWEKTYQKLPEWRFVIVGDGPYFNKLKSQIEQKQLPRIQLEGHQNPEPYFETASIFMMPSAFEGFPNVILEAQSYGVIPVAFDSYPALSWIINDQRDGLLSKPFDTKSMAEQIIGLASHNKKMDEMKKAALINAKHFTIEEVGRQWMDLFHELSSRYA
jgi:glycosyltransferase involved in cell wall biosynthesis